MSKSFNNSSLRAPLVTNELLVGSLFLMFIVIPVIKKSGKTLIFYIVGKIQKISQIENDYLKKRLESLFERLKNFNQVFSVLVNVYLICKLLGIPVFFEAEFVRFWQESSIRLQFFSYRFLVVFFEFFVDTLPISTTIRTFIWELKKSYLTLMTAIVNLSVLQKFLQSGDYDLEYIGLTVMETVLNVFILVCNGSLIVLFFGGFLRATDSWDTFFSVFKTEKSVLLHITKIPEALTKTCCFLILRERQLFLESSSNISRFNLVSCRLLVWASLFFAAKNFLISIL